MNASRLTPLFLPALLVAAAAASQSDAAPKRPAESAAPPAYAEEVEVNVVSVDVVVTDSAGRPVLGLERDDFELIEDGEPVELTNFSAIGGARPTAPKRVAETAPEAPPAAPARQAEPPAAVVLYFDNSTLIQAHRNRVLDDVKGFVDGLAGRARFLVVAFNPGLTLVSPFTDDPEAVRAALDRVAKMPTSGVQSARERSSTRDGMSAIWSNWENSKGWGEGPDSGEKRGIDSAKALGTRGRFFDPCVEAWPEMLNLIEIYANSEVNRVRTAQAGLLGLTRALVGVPGRKYVLYLSDGLELVPAMAEYEMLGEWCPERVRELNADYSRFDQTSVFEELTALANAHRVTFYALDTTGLSGSSAVSAELDDKRFAPSAQVDTIRRENLRGSLFTIADQTAGRAIFNANRPAPELADMAQDISNYYSLGFRPRKGWDGEVHKVKVKLAPGAGDGYRLRYRTRYRALPEVERVAERTLTALVLGAADNPLGISVEALAATALEGGRYQVPLAITLPIDRLTLLAEGGAKRGEVRVVVAVAKPEEHRNSLFERSIPVEIAERPADGKHVVTIQLRFLPGSHVIGLGVEDRLGKVVSFLQTEIEVAGAA